MSNVSESRRPRCLPLEGYSASMPQSVLEDHRWLVHERSRLMRDEPKFPSGTKLHAILLGWAFCKVFEYPIHICAVVLKKSFWIICEIHLKTAVVITRPLVEGGTLATVWNVYYRWRSLTRRPSEWSRGYGSSSPVYTPPCVFGHGLVVSHVTSPAVR